MWQMYYSNRKLQHAAWSGELSAHMSQFRHHTTVTTLIKLTLQSIHCWLSGEKDKKNNYLSTRTLENPSRLASNAIYRDWKVTFDMNWDCLHGQEKWRNCTISSRVRPGIADIFCVLWLKPGEGLQTCDGVARRQHQARPPSLPPEQGRSCSLGRINNTFSPVSLDSCNCPYSQCTRQRLY